MMTPRDAWVQFAAAALTKTNIADAAKQADEMMVEMDKRALADNMDYEYGQADILATVRFDSMHTDQVELTDGTFEVLRVSR